MSATVRNLGGGGGKVQGYIIPASDNVSISGFTGTTETVALNIIGDGALSVSSSDSTKATGSISGNILTITAVASGNATITITMADSSTYLGTTATISVECGIITIGNTYFFGGFYWTAAENLGDNAVCMQSQGMTAGSWPAYKLTTDYTGTKNYGSADTAYNGDIDGDNIANYDATTQAWYQKYSAVEKTGASYGAGLFLVNNAKCGSTTSGDLVSTNYGDGLVEAGLNYVALGATHDYVFLGTYGSANQTCWIINPRNQKLTESYSQYISGRTFPIAPAFNLDLTKVKIDGTTIMLKSESKPTIVSWANGTDAEIVAMVQAADNGIIDLYDEGWRVGDERSVSLSAITTSGTYDGVSWTVGEAQSAQTQTFVLMHKGSYELTTPTSAGKTRCNFVVGLKNAMETLGYMNDTNTNTGSWNDSKRRSWCNGGFRQAIPSAIRGLFKQFKCITAQTYNGTTNQISNDYFAIPALKEVMGSDISTYGNSTENAALGILEYYQTSSNRIKKQGNNGSAYEYWIRTPNTTTAFYGIDPLGQIHANPAGLGASLNYAISLFGCI